MEKNSSASLFKISANTDLGDTLTNAKKETLEATAILPQEASTRQAYSDACLVANDVLLNSEYC